MSAQHLCPNCGHPEQPVSIGALEFEPDGLAKWDGRKIDLQPAQHAVLGSLIRAEGRIVSAASLAEYMGWEIGSKSIHVHVCLLRKALAKTGAPSSIIRTISARGYVLDIDSGATA